MKRFVLPLVVILVIAGAAGLYIQRRGIPQAREAATWLPGGTILFDDLPDLHRTAERWPATDLAQILNEPEIQAFFERPLGQIPDKPEVDKRKAEFQRIDPEQFFLAVTDWSGGGAPKTIVGLACSGDKEDLDSLVVELRNEVQETWPAGKSAVEKYGNGEIQTFTTPDFSAGLAYRGHWLFISTDTALLKATLDRYEGAPAADSLAELPAFKTCLRHMPGAADNLLFIRPGLLADKLSSLTLMLNPTADVHGSDKLKTIDAVSMALKLDGPLMRDAAYVIEPAPGQTVALAKDALKLSSSDTIIAASERIDGLGEMQLPDAASDPSGVLALLNSYAKAFTGQGLGPEQLVQAFGPETGFVLDWPAGAIIPTPMLMAGVRDPAKARKFLDTLATLPLAGGSSFTHMDSDGIAYYSLPPTGIGLFPLQATLGLTDKCVIGALSTDAVRQAAKRWDAGRLGLAEVDEYKKAAGLVQDPTVSFTYVNTKAIFERLYGLFKAVASMGFVPHLADYVDIGKMPAADAISRHLSPIVTSGAVKDGGLLLESAGPVTTTQAAMATAVIVGAAAIPIIEKQFRGQSVALPSIPGFGPGPQNSRQNLFTSPSNQGGSTVSPTPDASAAPAASQTPVPSASPSAGTP